MLVLLPKGYWKNINFISETFNIPLLLLFSLFGFGDIFLNPLYSLQNGKSLFCSRTLTQRSYWAKGIPVSAFLPAHFTWELCPTPSMPQPQAGRKGFPCSFERARRGYIKVQQGTKAPPTSATQTCVLGAKQLCWLQWAPKSAHFREKTTLKA